MALTRTSSPFRLALIVQAGCFGAVLVWYAGITLQATRVVTAPPVDWKRQALIELSWLIQRVTGEDDQTSLSSSSSQQVAFDYPYHDYHAEHPCTLEACRRMRLYTQQHGHAQLEREWQACQPQQGQDTHEDCVAFRQRRFVVVEFSCPHEAGNLLHVTLNKILWGVLSNRTVLLRYMTQEVCHEACDGKFCSRCRHQADLTEVDCARILHTAAWMPRYETWHARRRPFWDPLLPAVPVYHPYEGPAPWHDGNATDDNTTTGTDENDGTTTRQPHVVVRLRSAVGGLHTSRGVTNILAGFQKGHDSARVGELRHVLLRPGGNYFLLGMLFHHVWSFTDAVMPPESSVLDDIVSNSHNHSVMVAHARHPHPSDTSVREQVHCLSTWMRDHDVATQGPCAVVVMADRRESVDMMVNHTRKLRCTPLVAAHEDETGEEVVVSREHGPFAGAGFFRDAALAAHVGRYGFTTNGRGRRPGSWMATRTSSQWVWGLLVYRAAVEGGRRRPRACGFLDRG